MKAGVRKNGDFFAIVEICGSNNLETVVDRRVHAATGLASTELFFHSCNVFAWLPQGCPQDKQKNEGRGA